MVPTASYAAIYKVWFNAWTTNYTDPAESQMNFWVEVFDTVKKNPPTFVATIKITAPDGTTVLNLDPVQDWMPYDKGYWGRLYAGDYDADEIAKGIYKCEVTDEGAKTITKTDVVKSNLLFLDPPTVTYPTDGATNVELMPKIKWNRVAKAKYYRILLWDESWDEPRYWFWEKKAFTDSKYFEIPKGELKLGNEYRLRIEARSGDQDMDKRSRSDWINFTVTTTP
jgi:hypothetical protein